jgi:hypothetical protein
MNLNVRTYDTIYILLSFYLNYLLNCPNAIQRSCSNVLFLIFKSNWILLFIFNALVEDLFYGTGINQKGIAFLMVYFEKLSEMIVILVTFVKFNQNYLISKMIAKKHFIPCLFLKGKMLLNKHTFYTGLIIVLLTDKNSLWKLHFLGIFDLILEARKHRPSNRLMR